MLADSSNAGEDPHALENGESESSSIGGLSVSNDLTFFIILHFLIITFSISIKVPLTFTECYIQVNHIVKSNFRFNFPTNVTLIYTT